MIDGGLHLWSMILNLYTLQKFASEFHIKLPLGLPQTQSFMFIFAS